MKALLRFFDRAFLDPIPAQHYAAVRIGVALFLLGYFLPFAPHLELFFSSQGVYAPVAIPDIAPSPFFAWVIYGSFLLAIAALLVGYRTRIAAPLVLLFYAYHLALNLALKNTVYDRLTLIFLVLLCFAPLDRCWSLRPTGASDSDGVVRAPPLFARLLQLQLVSLYVGSGLWKATLSHEYWFQGEMMLNTMIGPWASPLAFWIVNLGLPLWFWTAVTWSVWVWELAGPLLYIPRARELMMLVGVVFHLSIAFLLNIPQFLVCVAIYPLFLSTALLDRWALRCARRAGLASNFFRKKMPSTLLARLDSIRPCSNQT